ncbi:CheR family methyltransferase [Tepidibacter hydrothermalis]|uniref:CheR family methyltransferase n=1 Tax=Tepidibacter hydrothermalis TaxID=3036126 RepID=A0ABY8EEC4_9FIRM|nr:CheR family methyltransferase [Tepidibacter hydrothermalis]WFD11282.1 CheR family methyltransferase [Tepidibacter hydrothermalis]
MVNNISKSSLNNINNFIETRFGLHFTEKRFNDLIRSISNAAKQKNIGLEEYINLILSNKLSKEDLKNLVNCLTIGETYFFRDKKLFDVMRQRILPDIINDRKYSSKSLKIWSAGCSSGEEAYSIAILVKELIPDYEEWDIEIIATDINHSSLSKAKKGIYSEWSFRGVDLSIKNKYFIRMDDMSYKLKDDILKLVKFYSLNLADSNYILDGKIMNNSDIVFCRNVLIYFSKYQASKIINRFYNNIVDGGWLVVAPTESLFLNDTSFIPVNINDMFLYNKNITKNNISKSFDNNVFNNIIIDENLIMQNEIMKNEMIEYRENLQINNVITIKSKNELPKKEKLDSQEMEAQEFETIARSFANEGKLEEAIEWCKKAISVDKINPFYYYLLASIQQEQGDINEAVISLKKVIYLDHNFIMAYFDLGNLNLKQDKYIQASKNFKNTLVLLDNLNEDDIVPYSEEMTVGVLKCMIKNIDHKGDFYGKV